MISALIISVAPSVPPVSAHQCLIPVSTSAYQCHISVPIRTDFQCHLSVSVSATYQRH
ncbi:unnamed protein product [Staurois parvus]|uniref:Uncharacterized protein n=1 Tax=Staurois parvus TaxID=386267 RepID=A0ABN9DQN4_9NEOB|nr:unnamed protein product [Staurois parvus]